MFMGARRLLVALAVGAAAACGGGSTPAPPAADAGADATQGGCTHGCGSAKDCPPGEFCCSPLPTDPPSGCSYCGHLCPAVAR